MPQVTVLADYRLPLALQLWVRSLRYDWNHLIVAWSAPKYDNLRKIISWSIVSKAFLRSMKTTGTPFRKPLSRFTDQLFVVSSKAVRVLCKEWKPTDDLITMYYHLSIGTVGRKQFFKNLRIRQWLLPLSLLIFPHVFSWIDWTGVGLPEVAPWRIIVISN